MKKILLILLSLTILWGGYEVFGIWARLSAPESDIGRIKLLDTTGKTIADLPLKGGYSIPYRGDLDIPLIRDIITIEDRRFSLHSGIDIIGKIGALRENANAGMTVRGGSTITEQYIKNRYFRASTRTFAQKIRESLWAIVAEIRYDKEEILRMYLDSVYMGNGVYGIGSALSLYFGDTIGIAGEKSSSAEIITRIKYPNLGNRSTEYRDHISEKLGYSGISGILPKRERSPYTNILPFVTERIRREIALRCSGKENVLISFVKEIPTPLCDSSDTDLRTSIDLDLSQEADGLLESTITSLEKKNIHNGSIYIWSEKDQKVLAYIGNRMNGRENATDMITRKRSVGSVLKPFVYLLALRGGANPDDFILDETRLYQTQERDISYVPENYIPKSYGPIPLSEALGNSLNSATVRLSESLGIGRIYDMYRSLGLILDHEAGYYGYGISLGAVELSLENIVSGYRSLTHIEEPDTFLLFDMLRENSNRSRTFGISSILNTSIPLAVKTGTSTDFRDNWTLGYNQDVIVGVWVGNTNREPMDDVSGVSGAGPIYHALVEMLIARGYITPGDPPLPRGVTRGFLCLDTSCFQKKSSFQREGYTRKSRPIDQLYYKEDFVTSMTEEEEEKWKIQ